MKIIRTILEDINPNQLGITNSHEHLVCNPPYWLEKREDDLLLNNPEFTKKDLIDFVNYGGKSIVDATAIDYGRELKDVSKLAQELGIHVIGTAGFNKSFLWKAHIPDRLKPIVGNFDTFEDWIRKTSIENLVQHVVNEVEVGMEGTNFKAGQVKFGTGYNSITDLEEKTIIVIAKAHKITNVPIHSHTEAGTMGLEQLAILKREGVDPSRVSFGHMDRNLDRYYHRKLLDSGAYLSFDGLGKNKYATEEARIQTIIDLIKEGYVKQILLGGDTARKTYYKHYGFFGLGLGWMLETWVPRFKEELTDSGLDADKIVYTLLVENPRRYLEYEAQNGK